MLENLNKMKELVIFDVDNTIVKGQSQELFLNFLYKNGYIPIFYYLRIMVWFIFYKLGLVKNPLSIMKYAFVFVKNKEVTEIDIIAEKFFENVLKKRIYPESIDIIKEHQKNGREVILVSNAADILVEKIAKYLNVSEFLSTKLEIIGRRYTGNITGDIMYGGNKLKALNKYLESDNFYPDSLWSYADHSSDIPLLSQTAHPHAVNPTKKLKENAITKNWPILNFRL